VERRIRQPAAAAAAVAHDVSAAAAAAIADFAAAARAGDSAADVPANNQNRELPYTTIPFRCATKIFTLIW